jgi:hypothetical protein
MVIDTGRKRLGKKFPKLLRLEGKILRNKDLGRAAAF